MWLKKWTPLIYENLQEIQIWCYAHSSTPKFVSEATSAVCRISADFPSHCHAPFSGFCICFRACHAPLAVARETNSATRSEPSGIPWKWGSWYTWPRPPRRTLHIRWVPVMDALGNRMHWNTSYNTTNISVIFCTKLIQSHNMGEILEKTL